MAVPVRIMWREPTPCFASLQIRAKQPGLRVEQIDSRARWREQNPPNSPNGYTPVGAVLVGTMNPGAGQPLPDPSAPASSHCPEPESRRLAGMSPARCPPLCELRRVAGGHAVRSRGSVSGGPPGHVRSGDSNRAYVRSQMVVDAKCDVVSMHQPTWAPFLEDARWHE